MLNDGRCDLVIGAEGAPPTPASTCVRWGKCRSSLPLQPIVRWDIAGLAARQTGQGMKWFVSRLKQMRLDTDCGLLTQK